MTTINASLDQLLFLMNQTFDIERKVRKMAEPGSLKRNLDRMNQKFSEMGLEMMDPTGEPYNETRIDCEANISGDTTENLVITEVIKPIIRKKEGAMGVIVQKAVVIVAPAN